jgi:uncharacterized membrane protein YhiD involved in acid resistance
MWSSILASVLSLFSSFFKKKVDQDALKNSPEMEANQVARDEVVRQDEVETKVTKAFNQDEKALDDLRNLSAE